MICRLILLTEIFITVRNDKLDERNGKFIQAFADVTTGSGYDAVVSRHLTDQRPLKALKKLRDQLLADADHSKQKLFDMYFTSYRFPSSVTVLVERCGAHRHCRFLDDRWSSLAPNHPLNDPHPDSIPSRKKAEYLHILLTPIECVVTYLYVELQC